MADGTAVSELKTECKLLSAVFVADRPRVCLRMKFPTNKVVSGSKLTGLVHAKVSECKLCLAVAGENSRLLTVL